MTENNAVLPRFAPRIFSDKENYPKASFEKWDNETQRLRNEELESKYPGITYVFHELLGMIPWKSSQITEFPFAAAIVRPIERGVVSDPYKTLEIISKSLNKVKKTKLPTNHAEKWVIEDALTKLGVEHLPADCIVVSTVEPCVMCSGVIAHAGAKTVIYGASQEDIQNTVVLVHGEFKKTRSEIPGYSSSQIINERRHYEDVEIDVEGGCCRNEVLSRMLLAGRTQVLEEHETRYRGEENNARLRTWIESNAKLYKDHSKGTHSQLDRNALLEE